MSLTVCSQSSCSCACCRPRSLHLTRVKGKLLATLVFQDGSEEGVLNSLDCGVWLCRMSNLMASRRISCPVMARRALSPTQRRTSHTQQPRFRMTSVTSPSQSLRRPHIQQMLLPMLSLGSMTRRRRMRRQSSSIIMNKQPRQSRRLAAASHCGRLLLNVRRNVQPTLHGPGSRGFLP